MSELPINYEDLQGGGLTAEQKLKSVGLESDILQEKKVFDMQIDFDSEDEYEAFLSDETTFDMIVVTQGVLRKDPDSADVRDAYLIVLSKLEDGGEIRVFDPIQDDDPEFMYQNGALKLAHVLTSNFDFVDMELETDVVTKMGDQQIQPYIVIRKPLQQ